MQAPLGSLWGPSPLPVFLSEQLALHGFSAGDAGLCARQINEQSGTAAAASLFVNLGACKVLEGDIDGAIAAWRHAISSEHDAAAARALLNLGLLYEHLHLPKRAIEVLRAVTDRDIDPYMGPAAMITARCQLAQGESDQAMETMARLAQLMMARRPDGPELIETLYGLGEVAEDAGRLDRAERSWRVAAATDPSPIQRAATVRLIQLLIDQGRDDELLDVLELDSTESLDHFASAVLAQAEAVYWSGGVEQAGVLAASINSQVLDITSRFRLVDLRVQCGLVNEAIDELELLFGHNEVEVQARAAFSLGEVYRSYEMLDAATSMYERVIDHRDRYWSPKAELALGDLLDEKGDHAAAAECWARAATSEIAAIEDRARARLGEVAAPAVVHEPAIRPVNSEVASSAITESEAAPTADERDVASVEPAISLSDGVETDVAAGASSAGDATAPAPEVIVIDDNPSLLEVAEDESDDEHAEPVVVVLASLEGDGVIEGPITQGSPSEQDPTAAPEPTSPTTSVFARHLGEEVDDTANPYASLAPDSHDNDVPATTRNPYAELAPNFDDVDIAPTPDVEPGDWESMLEDWPRDVHSDPSKSNKKRLNPFSRHT